MKLKNSFFFYAILLCVAIGASSYVIAQSQVVTLYPGQSVQVVCEQVPTNTPIPPTFTPEPTTTNTPQPTSTPIPTNTIVPTSTTEPTYTPIPTETATSTPTPQPTNTPIPSHVKFGGMDINADRDYEYWAGIFDLARDRILDGAVENGVDVLVPLITNFSRQCTTDGLFDYDKCLAEALSAASRYNSDAIVSWYIIDEPHNKEGAIPTYQELDDICGELRTLYPDIACGYNAPADWLYQGYPYDNINMALSQSNFGRLQTYGDWENWAINQSILAREIVGYDGQIYLSFNAESFDPTPQDYEIAMSAICSVNPTGVLFWSLRMPHTQATMTRDVAIHLREICNGGNPQPTQTATPQSTVTPQPTNTIQPTSTPSFDTLIIDYSSDVATLTQVQLDYARQRVTFFNHKSIGTNILDGMRLLADQNPTRYSINIVYSSGTSQGINEYQAGSNYYPLTKVSGFESNLKSSHDIAMMKYCTSDIPCVLGNTPINQMWTAYRDMMVKYDNVVWWTMPIIARGTSREHCNQELEQYNTYVRDYVNANGGILFDVADIE